MADLPVLAVVGPTGSGKSHLALALAEEFQGEIVNCDSLQLYRYMDIGTAKTPPSERRGIPHHLIDILNPDQVFNAGDYMRLARPLLHEISARGHLPIVVGGTGFYLRALWEGLFAGPGRDEQLRERLALRGSASVHRLLQRFDKIAASRIHPNDTRKSIRALEVCLLLRTPMTTHHQQDRNPLRGFRSIQVGLQPGREELAAVIDTRCRKMFETGLVEEVRSILAMGFPSSSKALESIGYREALQHLNGELTLEEAIARAQISTRQYAKRQRTWFRKEPTVTWFDGFGLSADVLVSASKYVQRSLGSAKFIAG